ncbi:MAG: hypothetical protein ACI8WM_002112 [Burkholderiaceae bacterium]|jgi:hypothetical protein
MRTSSLKHIAVLLFVIVMTNLCVWSFSADRLAHELEHNHVALVTAAHAHVDAAGVELEERSSSSYIIDNDNEAPSGFVAHQVLHAVDHLQFFPDTAPSRMFLSAMVSIAPLHFTEQALPALTRDPLFRPPRHFSA